MSVIVFVWEMFKFAPGELLPGVGHASLYVNGPHGVIYVSYWPAAHNMKAGWSSQGKIHFMNGDKLHDGTPSWASKPLNGLDEAAIIRWWARTQPDPLIHYQKKESFQKVKVKNGSEELGAVRGSRYNILRNQCSTNVVDGLVRGADVALKLKILAWKHRHSLVTVTPRQVRNLVEDVF